MLRAASTHAIVYFTRTSFAFNDLLLIINYCISVYFYWFVTSVSIVIVIMIVIVIILSYQISYYIVNTHSIYASVLIYPYIS
jgi:hypothetical protein